MESYWEREFRAVADISQQHKLGVVLSGQFVRFGGSISAGNTGFSGQFEDFDGM